MRIAYALCTLALLIPLMPAAARSLQPTIAGEGDQAPKVYLAFFGDPGCPPCDEAWGTITRLTADYPALEARRFDVVAKENVALREALFERYEVPSENRDPGNFKWVFVGDDYLSGASITERNLRDLIEKYLQTGTGPPWEETGVPVMPSALTLLTMTVTAGLGDGINPCALAVVVFFVSYLAYLGRERREIEMIGISYISGVFLTYLSVGLVLLLLVTELTIDPSARLLVRVLTGAFALIVGSISLYDYYLFKRGRVGEMKLQLPRAFKGEIHSIIRKTGQTAFTIPLAFGIGVGVSFFEFACTGQVLFPYLSYLATQGLSLGHAFVYLLIYNLMFILPLLAVFLLASLGVRSERLVEAARRHTGKLKLIIAVILFALAALLFIR